MIGALYFVTGVQKGIHYLLGAIDFFSLGELGSVHIIRCFSNLSERE